VAHGARKASSFKPGAGVAVTSTPLSVSAHSLRDAADGVYPPAT